MSDPLKMSLDDYIKTNKKDKPKKGSTLRGKTRSGRP